MLEDFRIDPHTHRRQNLLAILSTAWELADQLGISSIPTFVVDGKAVVGAQPYEVLEQLLLDKGVKRKRASRTG
jgi:predicted DsbA family dithiol-disulfide isomerase